MQGLKARFHFFQALGQIRGVADLASTGQGQKKKKHIRLDHKQNWLGRNNISWVMGYRGERALYLLRGVSGAAALVVRTAWQTYLRSCVRLGSNSFGMAFY